MKLYKDTVSPSLLDYLSRLMGEKAFDEFLC